MNSEGSKGELRNMETPMVPFSLKIGHGNFSFTVSPLYTHNTLYGLDFVLTTLGYDSPLWPYRTHQTMFFAGKHLAYPPECQHVISTE